MDGQHSQMDCIHISDVFHSAIMSTGGK